MRCEHVHKDDGYENALCEDCYSAKLDMEFDKMKDRKAEEEAK